MTRKGKKRKERKRRKEKKKESFASPFVAGRQALSINCCDNATHSSVVLRPGAESLDLDDWICDHKVSDILHAGRFECREVEILATAFRVLFSVGSP